MSRAALAIVLVALAASSCGSATGKESRGGREGLPGDVPPGVRFAPEDKAAPKAPGFVLTLLDGTRVDASDLWAKRPVVLVFFASWCGNCADQQDVLNEIARKHRDVVAFLGVVKEDTREAVLDYLRKMEVPYAVGIDGEGQIWRSYAVEEPPLVAVVSKGGRLIKGWPGGTTKPKLESALAGLFRRTQGD